MIDNEVFKVEKIKDNLWVISGAVNELIYVIEGTEKSMVVDTGIGVGDLRAVIESITSKPLIVVNTHGHPDHAGGNPQFEEILMNEDDIDIMMEMCSDTFRINDMKSSLGEENPILERNLKNLINYKTYNIVNISEGDIISLGNIEFKVYQLPGHTPGSIVLLDEENGMVFSGDSIVSTDAWLYLNHSKPLKIYSQSLKKFRSIVTGEETYFPGHSPTKISSQYINDLIQCTDEIIKNPNIGVYKKTFAGEGLYHSYNLGKVIYDPCKIK